MASPWPLRLGGIGRAELYTTSQQAAPSGLPGRAVALREALLGDPDGALTPTEKAMMAEWLDRLADRPEKLRGR